MDRASRVSQGPIPPRTDLRDMLRRYLIRRSLDCMEAAARRRRAAVETGETDAYRQTVRDAVRGLYGPLPVGSKAPRPRVTPVSVFEKGGYRIENVLFDSFPGWQVNATVYVPADFSPPFPAVIVAVGHSGKQFASYQLPCQLFARCGFLAVCFDPPGQAGEKRPGNDHFVDGVRCYPVGESSSRYFVADALRCVDYLATRPDADLRSGVAMTGVSGGGTTTLLANLLDDRVTVIGPSCCVTPLADLDITQCYAGCPETHMFGRYAAGLDEVDLLCAAAPKAALLMAGRDDEVFRIEDTQRLAEDVREFYRRAGEPERFEFFVDSGGHAYSIEQARQFCRFMDRWLRGRPAGRLLELPCDSLELNPPEELHCRPRTDVNMRSLSVDRARELARARSRDAVSVRAAAGCLAGARSPANVPASEVGEPFRVWSHFWRELMLRPEDGIELPATFLSAVGDEARPTLLHFDDAGRHRLLHRQGPLARAIRFTEECAGLNLLTVDLRGWGDTAVSVYPYELAGWGGTDRFAAYMSAALGDSVMAMRIRDGLASLAWLRTRPETNSARIVVTGGGLGGIVALHVAAIAGDVAGVATWDMLWSIESLLAAEKYSWPADAFIPNILVYYDLPELAAALSCPVRIFNPLDGGGANLPDAELAEIAPHFGRNSALQNAPWPDIIRDLQGMLG